LTGIFIIVKKEVSDAVSNRTFLLSLGVLMLSMTLTGATSRLAYFNTLANYQALKVEFPTLGLIIINDLVPHVKVLGALVAVAFSFSSINKERTEGSLKVLLSYPIYRDQIILGKLVAGLIVVSIVTVASLAVALVLYLFSTNLSFTPDLILRFFTFTLLSIFLLSGYLGLSMLFSIAFKDQKTTLLAMFLLIGLFNSQASLSYGRILSDAVYGPERNPDYPSFQLNPQAIVFRDFVAKLSPSYSFESTSLDLWQPFLRAFVGDVYIRIPSDVWSVIINHLYSIGVLAVVPFLTFVGSYILFMKRDIT